MILSIQEQQAVTNTIARINISGDSVLCSFKEHNDQFRTVVKHYGLSWFESQLAWVRRLDPQTNGTANDRAAELAAALISKGFIVDLDDAIAEAVQEGSWQPEIKRWIYAKAVIFHLRWRGVDEGLYFRARLLPESAYDSDNKSVTVPALYFSEVIGFSEEHDFHFTTGAKLIRGYSFMVFQNGAAIRYQHDQRV